MIRNSDPTRRRFAGAYYTPPHVAEYMVRTTLDLVPRATDGHTLRVLEPSCGDGNFLEALFHWLAAREPRRARSREGRWELVRAHIHAVDVDARAVDLARRRLARLIAGPGAAASAVRAIASSLSENILVGNAVVGPDIRVSRQRRGALQAFDWRRRFARVFDSPVPGFDAVVGNPPYVNIRRLTQGASDVKEYFKDRFRCARGAFDLYVLFIERAYELLRPGGACGYIVPNKIATLGYAETCRRLLVERTTMCEIVDASAARVFSDAGVYPYVVVWRKSRPPATHHVVSRSVRNDGDWKHPPQSCRVPQRHLDPRGGFLLADDLAVERRGATRPLRALAEIHSGATGFVAQALAAQLNDGGAGVDFIVSRNIDRYRIETGRVRFMKRDFRRPRLELARADISERKRRLYASPKIVVAGMTRRIEAAVDLAGVALGVQVFAVIPAAIDFDALAAILNSRLLTYLMHLRFRAKRLAGGYLAINKAQLAELPIAVPAGDDSRQSLVVRLAELGAEVRRRRGTHAASEDAHPDLGGLDREIDQCVYRLYGIADHEVRRVERELGPLTNGLPST